MPAHTRTLALGSIDGLFYSSIRHVLHHFGEVRFRSERAFADTADLLSTIRVERFDQVLMPNPYGNVRRLACYRALRGAGVTVIASDRGALPDTWFFDHGFNYDSPSYAPEAWDRALGIAERASVEDYIARLRRSAHTLETQGPRHDIAALRTQLGLKDQRVLFVPLQRPNDTVVRYFAGEAGSVEGLVRLAESTLSVLDRIEPGKWCVALKKHPLEDEHIPPRHPRARYVPDSTHIHDLLELADAVLVLNSGVGLLSLCFGKPTFHAGLAFYGHEGLSREAHDPERLARGVHEGLRPDPEKVQRFIHHLNTRVYSACSIHSQPRIGEDGNRFLATTKLSFKSFRKLGEDLPVIDGEKVLIVSPVIPANVYRGSEARVGAMIRALVSQGKRVSLAVLNSSHAATSSATIAQEIWQEFPSLIRVEVRRHPKFFSSVFGKAKHAMGAMEDRVTMAKHQISSQDLCPSSFRRLVAQMCSEDPPDFLLVNYAKMAPAIPSGFDGIKVVDTHDYQTRFLEEDQSVNGQRRHVRLNTFRRSEERALQAFDRIIAINPAEKEVFEKICPETPVFCVPAFTDPSYTPHDLFWGQNRDALFVGSQSNFNVSGLLWFIDSVLPRIREEAPDFRLTVVGNIHRARPIVGRRWDGVDMLGVVPNLAPHYEAAPCVVAPLLGGAGMKIKVVEALGFGKAMVVTPSALEGIRAADGRDVLVAESSEDFARAVLRITQDARLRRRLEDAARALHRREHSPRAVSEVVARVFLR